MISQKILYQKFDSLNENDANSNIFAPQNPVSFKHLPSARFVISSLTSLLSLIHYNSQNENKNKRKQRQLTFCTILPKSLKSGIILLNASSKHLNEIVLQ